MDRESVESANIKSIGYDGPSKVLEVEFLNSAVFQYNNVSESLYKEFMNSSSRGSFLHTYLRDGYGGKKI